MVDHEDLPGVVRAAAPLTDVDPWQMSLLPAHPRALYRAVVQRVVRAVDAVHATSPVLRRSLARASPSPPPGGRGARRVVLVVIGIVQPVLPPAVLALAGHVDSTRAPPPPGAVVALG